MEPCRSGIFFAFSKLFLTVFEWYFLVYGGCEGPDAAYVKLISSDGHEFIIKKNLALTSGTIKAMLSGPGAYAENESNEVNFREIPLVSYLFACFIFSTVSGSKRSLVTDEKKNRRLSCFGFQFFSSFFLKG